MKSKLSALIASQLPLHVRNTSEVFVTFLEAYFEWLEQRNNSLGLVNYFPENTDIDRTLDEFLENFLKTYAEYIPKDTEYNKRDLIKRLSDLYAAKGTTSAVKFLFRLVYNTDAEVFFPKENILRASNGIWEQKKTIRVRTQFGSINNITEKDIFWSNSSGFYTAKVIDVAELTPGVFDISLNFTQKVILNEHDIVNVVNPATNQIMFRGLVIKTPDFLSILNGGKFFQIGQIFEIEGSDSPTVFKVTDVDEDGSITGLRILRFGFNYQNDVITNIIPFSNAEFELNFTLNLLPDGSFDASIKDKVVNYEDRIQIDISYGDYNPNSYYAEDFVFADEYYTAYRIIDSKTSTGKPPTSASNQGFFNNLNLTEQDLLDSVATVRLNLGTISKYQGRWRNVEGFLNEPSIKIQDSLFYQDFSYVVQSNITVKRYRDMLLNVLHPVGTKFFSELLLTETLDLSQVIMVDAIRNFLLDLDSQVIPEDVVIKDIFLP